jgi:hypothetical protein
MLGRRFTGILTLAGALAVTGCGSSPGTQVPFGGLPPEAPPASTAQPAYPNVYDVPPARETKLATEQEQAAIEAELAAIRDKLNKQAGTLEKDRKATAR